MRKRSKRGLGDLAPSHKFDAWTDGDWKQACKITAKRDKQIGQGYGKGALDAVRLTGIALTKKPDDVSYALWKLKALQDRANKILGGGSDKDVALKIHLESMLRCKKHGLAYGQAPKRKK